jgi:hypothetical protein
MSVRRITPRRGPFWFAVLGNVALLGDATARMLGAAIDHAGRAEDAGPVQWTAAAAIAIAFAYGEGHHALARRFVPMVVERAAALDVSTWWRIALAPLTAAGLCFAPRARLVRSWLLVAGIATLIVAMRGVPPALRAGVDLGVGLALAWGALAMLRCARRSVTPLRLVGHTAPTEAAVRALPAVMTRQAS